MAAEFTEAEKVHLKKLFERLDVDHDGVIDAADLKALAAEFGKTLCDERAAELVAKADPGKTGKVNFDHFVSSLAQVMDKVKAVAVAVALFKNIDKDSTGKISRANLVQVVKDSAHDIPEAKVDELIAKVDKSGTGEICFKDFIVALAEFIKNRQA